MNIFLKNQSFCLSSRSIYLSISTISAYAIYIYIYYIKKIYMCDIHNNEFLDLDLHMYIDKALLPMF